MGPLAGIIFGHFSTLLMLMVGKERKWSKHISDQSAAQNDRRHMPSFDEKAHHQIQGPGDSHRDLCVAPLLGRWNVAGAVAELCVFVLLSFFLVGE